MKAVKTVAVRDNNDGSADLTTETTTTVLTEQTYELLKKLVRIILPGFSALYFGMAQIWGLPAAEQVVGSVALFTTFIGLILGVSSSRYNASEAGINGEFLVAEDDGGAAGYRLVLHDDPEVLKDQESITFKVKKRTF